EEAAESLAYLPHPLAARRLSARSETVRRGRTPPVARIRGAEGIRKVYPGESSWHVGRGRGTVSPPLRSEWQRGQGRRVANALGGTPENGPIVTFVSSPPPASPFLEKTWHGLGLHAFVLALSIDWEFRRR